MYLDLCQPTNGHINVCLADLSIDPPADMLFVTPSNDVDPTIIQPSSNVRYTDLTSSSTEESTDDWIDSGWIWYWMSFAIAMLLLLTGSLVLLK